MNDNLARKLPEREPERRKTPAKAKKKKQKFRWGLAVFSMVIFSLAMLLVMRYARVAELERQIEIAKTKYERIESSNISRQVRIQQNIDIESVEKIATEKLGMVKPSKNQIVHIDIPVEDNAMYNTESEKNFFAQNIVDGIGKIVAYLH